MPKLCLSEAVEGGNRPSHSETFECCWQQEHIFAETDKRGHFQSFLDIEEDLTRKGWAQIERKTPWQLQAATSLRVELATISLLSLTQKPICADAGHASCIHMHTCIQTHTDKKDRLEGKIHCKNLFVHTQVMLTAYTCTHRQIKTDLEIIHGKNLFVQTQVMLAANTCTHTQTQTHRQMETDLEKIVIARTHLHAHRHLDTHRNDNKLCAKMELCCTIAWSNFRTLYFYTQIDLTWMI